MEERVEAAETFFEAATNVAPNSVIAWTMLSLFYDGIENDIGNHVTNPFSLVVTFNISFHCLFGSMLWLPVIQVYDRQPQVSLVLVYSWMAYYSCLVFNSYRHTLWYLL